MFICSENLTTHKNNTAVWKRRIHRSLLLFALCHQVNRDELSTGEQDLALVVQHKNLEKSLKLIREDLHVNIVSKAVILLPGFVSLSFYHDEI